MSLSTHIEDVKFDNGRAYIDRKRFMRGKNRIHKRYGKVMNCRDCNTPIFVRDDTLQLSTAKILCPKCLPIGKNNGSWKGGISYDKNGYRCILKRKHPNAPTNGYVKEHRLIMERKIGRYLYKTEIVHHINEIKDDNRIENLLLLPNIAEHRKIHKRT